MQRSRAGEYLVGKKDMVKICTNKHIRYYLEAMLMVTPTLMLIKGYDILDQMDQSVFCHFALYKK